MTGQVVPCAEHRVLEPVDARVDQAGVERGLEQVVFFREAIDFHRHDLDPGVGEIAERSGKFVDDDVVVGGEAEAEGRLGGGREGEERGE